VWLVYNKPLSHLSSFARWLSRHAALVSSITIVTWGRDTIVDGLPPQLYLEAAQQLLQPAIAAVGQDGHEHLTNISSSHWMETQACWLHCQHTA
jgi:hypothetical protein